MDIQAARKATDYCTESKLPAGSGRNLIGALLEDFVKRRDSIYTAHLKHA